MSRKTGGVNKHKTLEDAVSGMATVTQLLACSSGWGIDLERLHGNQRMAQFLSPLRDVQDTRGDTHQ